MPSTVAAVTVNKVCGSGLKAVMMAAQGVQLGDSEMVVAGGMESMSNAPYLIPKAREGYRLGNGELIDSMINDGLWCAFENYHMGCTGEVVADEYSIGRSQQDEFAMNSHRRQRQRSRTVSLRIARSWRLRFHNKGHGADFLILTKQCAKTLRWKVFEKLKPASKKERGNCNGWKCAEC